MIKKILLIFFLTIIVLSTSCLPINVIDFSKNSISNNFSYNFEFVAGSINEKYGLKDGVGTKAELMDLTNYDADIDSKGNIYLAQNPLTIRKVTPKGEVTSVYGECKGCETLESPIKSKIDLRDIKHLFIDEKDNIFFQSINSYRNKDFEISENDSLVKIENNKLKRIYSYYNFSDTGNIFCGVDKDNNVNFIRKANISFELVKLFYNSRNTFSEDISNKIDFSKDYDRKRLVNCKNIKNQNYLYIHSYMSDMKKDTYLVNLSDNKFTKFPYNVHAIFDSNKNAYFIEKNVLLDNYSIYESLAKDNYSQKRLLAILGYDTYLLIDEKNRLLYTLPIYKHPQIHKIRY
jgi:hypothetical protein